MSRASYLAGKALQVAALAWMPLAIWVGEIDRDESGSITIFLASIATFLLGLLVCRLASKS